MMVGFLVVTIFSNYFKTAMRCCTFLEQTSKRISSETESLQVLIKKLFIMYRNYETENKLIIWIVRSLFRVRFFRHHWRWRLAYHFMIWRRIASSKSGITWWRTRRSSCWIRCTCWWRIRCCSNGRISWLTWCQWWIWCRSLKNKFI